MDSRPSNSHLQILLVVLCLLLFFFGLGARDLWDVDEGMHSVSAKHVVESGDWVTPVYNGEAFFDKPMFFTWLVAISFGLLGFTELAARLPAAIVGLAGVWVTYRLGREMFGPRAGFFGGAVLATSMLYLVLSRTVVHDIALGLFTTLALYLFYRAVEEPRQRRTLFLLFYVAVAGAVLAKGPLGVVLPALVIGPYLLLTRRLTVIREMRLGWGVLIFLAITAPWYVLMSLRNEGYLAYFLLEKTFGSFASQESTHPAPVHFYIPVLLGALLPWTPFFPVAVYRAARRLRGKEGRPYLFLILWVGTMFLFFSSATSKLASYLLPLMPGAALLVGRLWDEETTAKDGTRSWVLLGSLLPMVPLLGVGFVYGWLNPPLELESKYGLSMTQILVVGLLITVLPVVALGFLWLRRPRRAFGTLVAVVAAVVVVFASWLGPAMDPYRSSREVALELDRRLPPAAPMVFFWREKDSALFYTDRQGVVLPTWEVEEYLAREEEALFVTDVRHLHRLAEYRDRFGFIYRRGSKVILSNRPESEVATAVPEGSIP